MKKGNNREKEDLIRDSKQLALSDVVANATMNRDRVLKGVNSYNRELRVNLIDLMNSYIQRKGSVAWLDLCCGKGRALIEASSLMNSQNHSENVYILGIDLIDDFCKIPSEYRFLDLKKGLLPEDLPDDMFDVITCIHGLHYIGDKLNLISEVSKILTIDGLFIANLDHKNIKGLSNKTLYGIHRLLSTPPLSYSSTKQILTIKGGRKVIFPYHFVGADDNAGPNYTLQPAVDSYYITKK